MLNEKERLRAFVASNYYVPDASALDEKTSFLKQGILDSTGVIELVSFVETEFGIVVEDEELVPQNFDSIAALSEFIRRKRGPHDGAAD